MGKNVGWDDPVEDQNLSIRSSLKLGIEEESVARRVHNLNFTKLVDDGFQDFMIGHHQEHKRRKLDIVEDVKQQKEFLQGKCGVTWRDFGGKRAQTLISQAPWVACSKAVTPPGGKDTQAQWIAKVLDKLVTWESFFK